MRSWLDIALAGLAALAAACSAEWKPAFDEAAAPGLFDSVAIADPDEALTFARVEVDGRRRAIAVTDYRNGTVHGVDLSAARGHEVSDPALAVGELGYEALRDLVRDARDDARVAVPAARLVIPLDVHGHHIAAATNFPEHADDAGVEDGPFLFAKLVQPTGPYDAVPASAGLLDYEVEVAWVALAPLGRDGAPEVVGLVLCNDLTDRETLLHEIDPWDVESGAGFTTGKSFPGYLPLGNLFVVPREHRRFVADLELRLYINGALRQRALAKQMVWDLDEILARTWAWQDRRWNHRGEQISLLGESGMIRDRTLILSGTPHGTVFDGLRTRHYLSGLSAWLAGGWNESLPSRVVSAYIDDAHAAGAYLRPGDRVEIHADRLGVLRNQVAPPSGGGA